MVGVDADLLRDAPLAGLPVAVEITIRDASVHPEVTGEAEAGMKTVAQRCDGRIVGTVRSDSELWTLVHLPTDESAHRFLEIPSPRTAAIEVQPTIDPDWTIFERLRPVGIEHQSMLDLSVLAGLHREGDRGGVRRVDHVVTGMDAEARDRFAAAATSVLGTDAIDVDVDGADDTVRVAHRADPVDITPDAWTLRQIAERHGGTYDGWGCEVLAPDAAGTAKKRWFRR